MLSVIVFTLFALWPSPVVETPQPEHAATPAKTASLAADPYAPLRLYDGKWDLVPATNGKPADPVHTEQVHLENRCAKVGDFFACNHF